MKILLATDGSTCSEAAAKEVALRAWPAGSEIKVISVVEPPIAAPPEAGVLSPDYFERAESDARAALDKALGVLAASQDKTAHVTSEVLKGSAKRAILDEAEQWKADLIVVGSHGYKALRRLLLGSVSQAVALHAGCSVEIVRSPTESHP